MRSKYYFISIDGNDESRKFRCYFDAELEIMKRCAAMSDAEVSKHSEIWIVEAEDYVAEDGHIIIDMLDMFDIYDEVAGGRGL